MRLPTEQLCAWFYTAVGAIIPAELNHFPPDAERQWLQRHASEVAHVRTSLVTGLKQGINDLLTMSKGLSPEGRSRLDDSLRARGLPSLRMMQATLKRKHQGILTRGRIRNDEEFYLVAEILGDLDFEVTKSERAMLRSMSADYETEAK